MKFPLIPIFLLVVLAACSDAENTTGMWMAEGTDTNLESIDFGDNGSSAKSHTRKSIDQMEYRIDVMTALYYLNVNDQTPSQSDLNALRKEYVLLLEIHTSSGDSDLFESEHITMDKEDAIKYLIGEVSKDIMLSQGDKEFPVNGVLYDGVSSAKDKIRLFVFFKDLEISKPVQLKYYDRLFGAGMIHFSQEVITNL